MKLMKVVIILFALLTLFAGCDMFIEPENAKLSGDNIGGDGKIAQVKVTIGGNARTILPNASFSKYTLSAESADEDYTGAVPSPVEIMDGNWGRIGLPYGDWIIIAAAYVNVDGVDYPAARGSVPISVYSDNNNYASVTINTPESGGTGTFAYKVTYPAGGAAGVELRPIAGGAAVVNAASVNSGALGSASVPSGVYFLTVRAANGRTVTRNEVVHIYQQSTTKADYVFTKLDFGAGSLNLSGTIKVLVNGQQPDQVNLSYSTDHQFNNNVNWDYINFNGTDGSGTWNIYLYDLNGANTLYFLVDYYEMRKEVLSIAVPVDDTTDINLGTVEFNIIPLASDTWVNGNIATSDSEDWYSINVNAGETYYFWFNNAYGDGYKTLYGEFAVYNINGYLIGGSDAWYDPASFTAYNSGTVYIKVRSWSDSGTYAIGYSTNCWWRDDPVNVKVLEADTWTDGNITTSSAVDWYSIDVTEGTTYYVWWNDSYNGDGIKTLDIDVYAYNSGGQFFGDDSGWDYPSSFTAYSNGTVYLRVRAYAGWSDTGTYAIAYSDSYTRP